MDRIEEEELVPAKKVLYQFCARGHDMAQVMLGLAAQAWRCGLRLLPLAASAPRARCAARRCAGSGHGLAGGYSDGRDIGVVFNYPNPDGAHALPMAAGSERNIRRRPAGRRRSPTSSEVLDEVRGRDRGGAGRRRELRDRWLLVRADHCDDPVAAAAHLYRGQWLRDLGPVRIPDAGQGHRGQPRQLAGSRSSTATAPIRPRRRG